MNGKLKMATSINAKAAFKNAGKKNKIFCCIKVQGDLDVSMSEDNESSSSLSDESKFNEFWYKKAVLEALELFMYLQIENDTVVYQDLLKSLIELTKKKTKKKLKLEDEQGLREVLPKFLELYFIINYNGDEKHIDSTKVYFKEQINKKLKNLV